MPMSPRLKMRRGRFGPGGFKGPKLTLFGPGGVLVFGPGSPAAIGNFTGTAFDDLDGDLSANIIWHVQGSGSPSAGLPSGSPDIGVVENGAAATLNAFLVAAGSPSFAPSSFNVIGTVEDTGGKRTTFTLPVTVETSDPLRGFDYIPNLTIILPLTGTTFGPGSPGKAEFEATAIDHEDGDISTSIEWFVNGPGSPGQVGFFGSPSVESPGAAVDLGAHVFGRGSPQGGPGSPGTENTFNVVARIIDSAGNVRVRDVTVTVDASEN